MAANRPIDPIVVADLRGGRNDTDPPMSLPANQATEFLNCDWKGTAVARKRGGAVAMSLTGGTAFTIGIYTIERHVPGASEAAAEFWAIDNAATPIWKRIAAGSSFADVTVSDAISTRPQDVVGVALNGKRFFAYDSSVDRLHVYDPNLASPRVRRAGFATPAAPTVANTGAGAYAAVLRYYRVRWLQLATIGGATTIVRRSEAGPSVSFTPSGGGTAARITQPTVASEQETHWEIEVSSDDATWTLLAGRGVGVAGTNQEIAIGTTTYDDTQVAANYGNGDPAPLTGTYSRFPSVKFLMTDGNRLLGGGAWEAAGADSAGKNSRIWHTPVLGSLDKGDDERIVLTQAQKNYTDLNENDGGAFTGCGGPLNGIPWWFKYRQVWKLQPTGEVTQPYLPRKMRDDIGCIGHKTIALGQDQTGRAALYFLSHRGPYRVTQDGDVEYLGRDNETTWDSMNLDATTVTAHSVYHADIHQWWVWIATGASNVPDVKMMFDTQLGFPDEHGQIRGGWAKHTGPSASAICSCLFASPLAVTMPKTLAPHIGRQTGTTPSIFTCDVPGLGDDNTAFQAYATTRPLLTTMDLAHKVGCGESTIIGFSEAGASDVSITINRDFGKETRTHTVDLGADASETRVIRKVEGSEMGEANAIQITVGDSAAKVDIWTVDAIVVPIVIQEKR